MFQYENEIGEDELSQQKVAVQNLPITFLNLQIRKDPSKSVGTNARQVRILSDSPHTKFTE